MSTWVHTRSATVTWARILCSLSRKDVPNYCGFLHERVHELSPAHRSQSIRSFARCFVPHRTASPFNEIDEQDTFSLSPPVLLSPVEKQGSYPGRAHSEKWNSEVSPRENFTKLFAPRRLWVVFAVDFTAAANFPHLREEEYERRNYGKINHMVTRLFC